MLDERERVPGVGRHAPPRLVVHVVPLVTDRQELLLPKRLHALHRPRVVCVREVDCVKVHRPPRIAASWSVFRFCNKARQQDHLPQVFRAVLVAQPRRADHLRAHLREREGGHAAEHRGCRLARLVVEEDESPTAAREPRLGCERNGHAKRGFAEDARWRAREQDVQVVHGGLVQRRPSQVRSGQRARRRPHRRQHHDVQARGAGLGFLARPVAVQLARDVREGERHRLGLALRRAVDAHATRAARARGQHIAALATRNGLLLHGCARAPVARGTSCKSPRATRLLRKKVWVKKIKAQSPWIILR